MDNNTDIYIKEGVFGVILYLYMRREVNPTSLFGYAADNPSEDVVHLSDVLVVVLHSII